MRSFNYNYKNITRCNNCILPENYPNINLNEYGTCRYCRQYSSMKVAGEEALNNLLNKYRGKGKEYDVLVPVSGGRDSTFTLYELVEKYDMNVLAYNYDNGLVSRQGKMNLENALKALDVDLVVIKHDQTKYFLNNLKSVLKRFSPAMIPTICLGCRYGIVGGACSIAKKHNIPLVVFASSRFEKTQFKNEFFKIKYRRRIIGMLVELTKNTSYFKPSFIPMYIKDYFHDDSHVHPISPVLKILYGKIDIIEYFDFINWNEEKIEKTITKVGWRKKKEEKSSWHLDCLVHYFKDYLYLNSVGFTERDDLLSNMIREGMIERDIALKRLFEEYDSKIENLVHTLDEIGREINLEISVLEKLKEFIEVGL